jgi:hypothetical protein
VSGLKAHSKRYASKSHSHKLKKYFMISYDESWAFSTPILVGPKLPITFLCWKKNEFVKDYFSWTPCKDQNAMIWGLIYMYFYLINIGPLSSWTLCLQSFNHCSRFSWLLYFGLLKL